MAHLENSSVPLAGLRRDLQRAFLYIIDAVAGKEKGLVLGPDISGALSLVVEVSTLRSHGIDRIYHMASFQPDTPCMKLIYVLRSGDVSLMHELIMNLQAFQLQPQKREFHLIFVPRRSVVCEQVLEEEGFFGEVNIHHWYVAVGKATNMTLTLHNIEYKTFRTPSPTRPMELVPYDTDVLCMQDPNAFKEIFLDGDMSAVWRVSEALWALECRYGRISHAVGHGFAAKQVAELLRRKRKREEEVSGGANSSAQASFGRLILIDRQCDLVTPLATQLTYEGLLDEVFGISNTYIDVDKDVVLGEASQDTRINAKGLGNKIKVPLNSGDELYAEIRDKNFAAIGPILNGRARSIDEDYRQGGQAHTLTQLRQFVHRLGGLRAEHRSLRIHTSVAECILGIATDTTFHRRLETEQGALAADAPALDYIEDCVYRKEPLVKVLRLLCLMSITSNGFKEKQYHTIRREILQTYGYENMFTLLHLERLGMLRKSSSMRLGRGMLALATGEVRTGGKGGDPSTTDRHAPVNASVGPANARSGDPYATIIRPLRLVIPDAKDVKPTDVSFAYSGYVPISVRMVQILLKHSLEQATETLNCVVGPTFQMVEKCVAPSNQPVLVFFVGGVTSAELSCLRWMAANQNCPPLVIGTSNILTGDRLLSSIIDTPSVECGLPLNTKQ